MSGKIGFHHRQLYPHHPSLFYLDTRFNIDNPAYMGHLQFTHIDTGLLESLVCIRQGFFYPVLIINRLVDQAVDYQNRVEKALADAYEALKQASIDMGKLKVAHISRVINIESSIKIKQRRVMGVQLPVVETDFTRHPPYFSPSDTSYWVDGALQEFQQALG